MSTVRAERLFTVKDAIEMQEFIQFAFTETSAVKEVGFSPDGRRFVVLTQRGLLESNELEATMWVYETSAVRRYARSGAAALRPLPRVLARIAASSNEDEPVISKVRWSKDSRTLMFLGRAGTPSARLYQVDVTSGALTPQTPPGQDVNDFASIPDGMIYTVVLPIESRPPPMVRVATGRSLQSLLFPGGGNYPPNRCELWAVRRGEPQPVLESGSQKPIRVNYLGRLSSPIWTSPDGHWAVVPRALEKIPKSWERYRPWASVARLQASTALSGEGFALDLPERLHLINLASGEDRLLIDAPLAGSLGYPFSGDDTVEWSPDSRRILIRGTFLPLEDASAVEVERRAQVPATVFYDIAAQSLELTDARTKHPRRPALRSLHVSVQQDLNAPPVLTVQSESDAPHPLWDPNAQLKEVTLGEAEFYGWQDREDGRLEGVLVKPPHFPAGKPYSLVIQPHPYAYERRSPRFMTTGAFGSGFVGRAMAARGTLVLQWPGIAATLDTKDAPRNAAIYQALIDQLVAQGWVDRRRVGIIGFSYDGYYVLHALTQQPALFAAATVVDGNTYGLFEDLMAVDNGQAFFQQFEQVLAGKPFAEGLQSWLRHSALFNMDRVTTPLRIQVHGSWSLLGHWGEYAALRQLGKPVDLIQLSYASHEVTKPVERLESQGGNVDWFDFWLNDHEDMAAEKKVQYARWRELRALQRRSAARS